MSGYTVDMKIIVGLGNPGKEYEGTRHNIGREVVTSIAKHFNFDAFAESKKYQGQVTLGIIGKEKTLLVLPDTYMNRSGKALASVGAKPKDIMVIHDDTDIVLGSVKISFGKRSAGHKGVDSIMRAVKSRDFWRIRIGVQPYSKTGKKKKRVDAMSLVLKKWAPAEKLVIKKIEKKILATLERPLTVTTITLSIVQHLELNKF